MKAIACRVRLPQTSTLTPKTSRNQHQLARFSQGVFPCSTDLVGAPCRRGFIVCGLSLVAPGIHASRDTCTSMYIAHGEVLSVNIQGRFAALPVRSSPIRGPRTTRNLAVLESSDRVRGYSPDWLRYSVSATGGVDQNPNRYLGVWTSGVDLPRP